MLFIKTVELNCLENVNGRKGLTMKYFIVIERTFNNWIDAPSESEAIEIALDKFENDCQTDVYIESEEDD